MTEPSLHCSLPFAILCRLGFNLPFCIVSSILAIVPDFDVLFKMHRSVTHSLLPYLPALILALFLHPYDELISNLLYAAWLALSSHILLDLLDGYSPALWPVVKDEFSISIKADAKFGHSFLILPRFELKRRKFSSRPFHEFEAELVTGEGLIISLLLILLSVLPLVR